jgi:hypothetical protein
MIINQTSDIPLGDAKGKQMGTPFRFLLLAAALPIVPALCAQSPPNQAATPPFSINITLAQDAVKAGAEVRLDTVLTNVSAEKIVIAECVEPNYQIEIYDNEAKPLPRLRDCVPKQHPDHPGWTTLCPGDVTTPSDPICLQQNQILKLLRPQEAFEEQTVVNTQYDLSRPGKYTIQVQLANDPRTFIEVPRKFRYGSQGLELDDKVNGVLAAQR